MLKSPSETVAREVRDLREMRDGDRLGFHLVDLRKLNFEGAYDRPIQPQMYQRNNRQQAAFG